MPAATLDYKPALNQSYSTSGAKNRESALTVSPSGSLYRFSEFINSTYSSTMDVSVGLTAVIDNIIEKATDFIDEIFCSYIDSGIKDNNIILSSLENKLSNMQGTIENFQNCLNYLDRNFFSDFPTEPEFDDDGELIFEWYGRVGARVNLTFGKNAELYFVSLFHGESTKSKLFINCDSAETIKNTLVKLYKDMA